MQSEIKIEISLTQRKPELISELEEMAFITKITEHQKDGIVVFLKQRHDYQSLLKILQKYKIMKIKEIETSLEELFLNS